MNSVVITNPAATTRLLVIMGVSGSGKTSVATALAQHYGYRYLDADDFHSESSRARMAGGLPLTDAMRAPWVAALQTRLRSEAEQNCDCTLAFSGLKHTHRDKIRAAGLKTLFIFLAGDKLIIGDRLQKRTNHFMAPGLLNSQFESLEDPSRENDVITIDISRPLDEVVTQAITAIDGIRGW